MQSRTRDTTTLAVGSVLSGLLAYLFFALTTRALGAAEAAPVSMLWTYWTFAAAALSFPLQHWIAQSAASQGGTGAVARAMPRLLQVVLLVTVLSMLVAWLFRSVLFHSDSWAYPVLVGVVTIGAAFIGVVRGGLTADHRFIALSITLVGENGTRCVAAILLIAAGDSSAFWYGFVLAAGSFIGAFWPSSYLFSRAASSGAGRASLRFLGGTASGQLIGQTVLTSGPVVLAFLGGTPGQITSLFAALALFRAPYQMALALVSRLTGFLTLLQVQADLARLTRVRRMLLAAVIVASPLAAAVGAWLGPWLLPIVFGDEVSLSAGLCAVIAVASTVALATLVATVMVLAQARGGPLARSWLVAAGVGLLVAVVGPGAPLDRTVWAFLVAEVVALVLLLLVHRVPGTPRSDEG